MTDADVVAGLLGQCLVRVAAPGASGGTGFFVAPGKILTCAHVVTGATGPIELEWKTGRTTSEHAALFPPDPQPDRGTYPFPDLAVITIDVTDHSCVLLDEAPPQVEHKLQARGFTHTWSPDIAEEEPALFTFEGVHEIHGGGLLKLSDGQAVPGMSGGALLSRTTLAICGLLKTTRDAQTSIGGWGIPITAAMEVAPDLLAANETFHRVNREWRDAATRHARTVDRLVSGVGKVSPDFAGRIENFLIEYLGGPKTTVPFGGRRAQLATLTNWLTTGEAPYALVAAEAGRGKSALLARWAQEVTETELAHVIVVPVSLRFNTGQAGVVFPALCARLAEFYGEELTSVDLSAEQWKEACGGYMRRQPPEGRRLLIVMDGLDEATDWRAGPDLFPASPPTGLRVLASARYLAGDHDETGWLDRLNWNRGLAIGLALPPLDQQGVREVLRAMGNPLDNLATQVDVVSELYRLSEGDPLIVRLYVEALLPYGDRAASIDPNDLPSIQRGVEGFFNRWWMEQTNQWRSQGRDPVREREELQDFLNVLASAWGPMTREDIAAVSSHSLSGLRLRALADDIGRFVIGDGDEHGFVFSHPKLGHYFRDGMLDREREECDQRFVDYGARTLAKLRDGSLRPEEASAYAVRFYATHLDEHDARSEQVYELVCKEWLHAWQALEGSDSGFLNDTERAWKRAQHDAGPGSASDDRQRAFEIQVLCALARSSVASKSDSIPDDLLYDCTREGVITPAQALAICQRISNEFRRATMVVELARILPAEWLEECRKIAAALVRDSNRGYALEGLAPCVPEASVPAVLRVALGLDQPKARARALAAISHRLAPDERVPVLSDVYNTLRSIDDDPREQARAVLLVAPHVSGDGLQRLRSIIEDLPDDWAAKRKAIEGLDALKRSGSGAAIDTIPPPSERLEPRSTFLSQELPWPGKEEEGPLSRRLEGSLIEPELLALRTGWSTMSVKELAAQLAALPANLKERAHSLLELDADRWDTSDKFKLLARLAAAEGAAAPRFFVEDLVRSSGYLDPATQTEVLQLLAASVEGEERKGLLRSALRSAQIVGDVLQRIAAIASLALNVHDEALLTAHAAMAELASEIPVQCLPEILTRLPRRLLEPTAAIAVDACLALPDQRARVQALLALKDRVKPAVWPKLGELALAAALSPAEPNEQLAITKRLASRGLLADDVVDQALLDIVDREEASSRSGAALTALSALRTPSARIAAIRIAAANQRGGDQLSDSDRDTLFRALPEQLPPDLISPLYQLALGRPHLLALILPHLPERERDKALTEIVRRADWTAPTVVAAMFHRLSPDLQRLLLPTALDPTYGLPTRISTVAKSVPDELKDKVVAAALTLSPADQARAFGALRRTYPPELVAPLFEGAVRSIDEWATYDPPAVFDLAQSVDDPHAELLRWALVAATSSNTNAKKLRNLLRRLSASGDMNAWEQVLGPLEDGDTSPAVRVGGIQHLAADVPNALVGRLAAAAISIDDGGDRITAVAAMLRRPSPAHAAELWKALESAARELDVDQRWQAMTQLFDGGPLPDPPGSFRSLVDSFDSSFIHAQLLVGLAASMADDQRCQVLSEAVDDIQSLEDFRARQDCWLKIAGALGGCPRAIAAVARGVREVRHDETRMKLLDAVGGQLAGWARSDTAGAYEEWSRLLRGLSWRPRSLFAGEAALLSLAAAPTLAEDEVPMAFLSALRTVASWWP